jgi:NAD(P)-dependent dehydrogenase (short-subunit alcohol dehydrogenase family)
VRKGAIVGTYLVTGASSGIGEATYAHLERDGHDVVGVSRRGPDIKADLRIAEDRAAVVDAVRAKGLLDGIVASAGMTIPCDATDLVSVNFFGATEVIEPLRPLLATSGNSKVVVLSSLAAAIFADVPEDFVEALCSGDEAASRRMAVEAGDAMAYCASKVALGRWVRRLAPKAEWAGAGIRMNALGPGATRTPMLESSSVEDPLTQSLVDGLPIPLGRWAEPEEIADLIAALLSPAANYLVGQHIFADGGTEALIRESKGAWVGDAGPRSLLEGRGQPAASGGRDQ